MSQAASNAIDRIITGRKLKYTVTVHKTDGSKIEFQTDKYVALDWNNEARSLWLKSGEYGSPPIMEMEKGMVVLTEENPTP